MDKHACVAKHSMALSQAYSMERQNWAGRGLAIIGVTKAIRCSKPTPSNQLDRAHVFPLKVVFSQEWMRQVCKICRKEDRAKGNVYLGTCALGQASQSVLN
eukprot:1148783-Pelagomonas_calceolata.AAC.2